MEFKPLEFKPSVRPDVLRIIFISFVTVLVIYFFGSHNFSLGIFSNKIPDLFKIEGTNFLDPVSLIMVVYLTLVSFCLLHIIFVKFYYCYKVDRIQIQIIEGIIFKSNRTSPIRNIKNVDILTPSIIQFILGIRTLRLEIDGISGYDEFFLNVKNREEIKSFIFDQFPDKQTS